MQWAMIHPLANLRRNFRPVITAAATTVCCFLSLELSDEDLLARLAGVGDSIDFHTHLTAVESLTLVETDVLFERTEGKGMAGEYPGCDKAFPVTLATSLNQRGALIAHQVIPANILAKRMGICIPLRC
jgi:hypothetical protein